jgi:hypothetical protein
MQLKNFGDPQSMGENRVSMIGGKGHTNQRKRKPDQMGVRERLGRGEISENCNSLH